MELKLNIYNRKRDIVKTYTTDSCFIFYGTVEDIIGLLDGADLEDDMQIVKIICRFLPQIKVLLKDIFEGLTDEELKMTNISELARTCVDIVKFCINQITGLNSVDEKN